MLTGMRTIGIAVSTGAEGLSCVRHRRASPRAARADLSARVGLTAKRAHLVLQ